MVAPQSGTQSPAGVLLCGSVPPLADSYSLRPETGPDLARSLRSGTAVVLVNGAETRAAPAARDGTGKTQLAVEFAHAMRNSRAVEVMVWVTGASRESVVSGFAQAADTVDARHPTGVSASVLATWSIAAECAHQLPPAGLAWPTLVLAAVRPAGSPMWSWSCKEPSATARNI
jgi:hypothetical protein